MTPRSPFLFDLNASDSDSDDDVGDAPSTCETRVVSDVAEVGGCTLEEDDVEDWPEDWPDLTALQAEEPRPMRTLRVHFDDFV